ncbi:MAG: ArsI/CadI family heavy metal resistance metalloenzyme [Acidimicrobiales bacterium]
MTTSRVQLALNVSDLQAATEFYGKLFGAEPAKQRAGYANFAIADPPLKLVLIDDAHADAMLNHLGVEVASPEDVATSAARFSRAGLTTRLSGQEVCCHAVQDKVYVAAPEVPLGQWEFYTVVDDDPGRDLEDASATCCPRSPGGTDVMVAARRRWYWSRERRGAMRGGNDCGGLTP